MPSNLRSKPITGHITDSAGNVVRNSRVTIKSFTPNVDVVVDTVVTNDEGYFISAPLPNGQYAIYDSGVMITTVLHYPDEYSIECFEGKDVTKKYNTYTDKNEYFAYLQIEPEYLNVGRYGSSYPIYNYPINSTNLASRIGMNQESRITTTRFDVEYYPSATSKRVRFTGVPAVKLTTNSRLLIPLDYYSITPNMPKVSKMCKVLACSSTELKIAIDDANNAPGLPVTPGDVAIINKGSKTFYGIVREYTPSKVTLDLWKKYASNTLTAGSASDHSVTVYDGLNSAFDETGVSTNENFTVTENIAAQNSTEESYVK